MVGLLDFAAVAGAGSVVGAQPDIVAAALLAEGAICFLAIAPSVPASLVFVVAAEVFDAWAGPGDLGVWEREMNEVKVKQRGSVKSMPKAVEEAEM